MADKMFLIVTLRREVPDKASAKTMVENSQLAQVLLTILLTISTLLTVCRSILIFTLQNAPLLTTYPHGSHRLITYITQPLLPPCWLMRTLSMVVRRHKL